MAELTLAQLKAEYAKLQAENAKIKGAQKTVAESVVFSEYKGHPIMQFNGNHKPISLGCSKLRVVVNNMEKVKEFLALHPDKKE